MPTKNARLVDEAKSVFRVLELVDLTLPAGWWWHTDDIEQETARGSIFRAYCRIGSESELEVGDIDIASILVVDATEDQSEPNIPSITHAELPAIDAFLRAKPSESLAPMTDI